MPIRPTDARHGGAKLDAAITAKVRQFEEDLADAWGVLRKRIVALTNQLEVEQGRVVSTQVNLGVARNAAQQIQAAIEEAGYGAIIEDALNEMGDLATYQGLGQTRVARVERTTAWSAETLDAFRQLKLDELLDVPATIQRQVERILLRGIIGAQDRAELLTELLEQLELSLPQARTIYDTALSEFSRIAVTSTATGQPDEAFLYNGPIDALMRPFCAERVGQVFTRRAIDQMDNGQLPNTLITGGGYNCRHTWIPVPTDDPLAALADQGVYADEVFKADVEEAAAQRARMKAEKRKARGV